MNYDSIIKDAGSKDCSELLNSFFAHFNHFTDEEVEAMNIELHKQEFEFNVGDNVKVISGIFEGYFGVLQEISEDKKSLLILANTGKRDIPIMVDTKDVGLAD